LLAPNANFSPILRLNAKPGMEKRSHEKYLGGCLFMMIISLEQKQQSLNYMHDLLEVKYVSLEHVYRSVCKNPEVSIAMLKI